MQRMRAEQVRPVEMVRLVGKDEPAQAHRKHQSLDVSSKRAKMRKCEELFDVVMRRGRQDNLS